MEQAHRPGMEISAKAHQIVPPEPVLVPPVLHPLHVTSENQQERGQGPELVDPEPLLDSHPVLHLLRVPPLAPPPQVDHHHPRVEVARPPALERRREGRVRPEPLGEVVGEVGVAVLRGPDHVAAQVDGPELRHVVDDDQVRVEVDDAADARGEEVGEVDPRVVEGLVEGAPDGVGDLAADEAGVEVVEVEAQVREGGGDDAPEVGVPVRGGDEMEDDVLRAGGVLEDGEDAGDGAAEVGGVEGHGDVDQGRIVGVLVHGRGPRRRFGTLPAVSKCGCFSELRKVAGVCCGRRHCRRELYSHGDDEEEEEEGIVGLRWHGILFSNGDDGDMGDKKKGSFLLDKPGVRM
ncbi:hypothetical protein PanWU01x14_043510 [Parasponia andersonii]|uniref:Uncharacterized protein n=1 Tax=Parasponia andersonii TaxID=3476 RepID=A0A2P5DQ05_PARAD|nr:hypothetical protein PanWU01x14_043510 [Parasponia andersonii]